VRGYRADLAFDGERPIPGGALVLVEGATIVGVEPGSAAAPADCAVTYLPGATLLPGLIDAHVHLCADSANNALDRLPDMSADRLDAVIATAMRDQLAAGVTAVRDLGDRQWVVLDLADTDHGGPTVVASGPPITSARGHCWSMGGEATSDDQLRRAVQERAERGASVVKIMTRGGVLTPGTDVMTCQFTLGEVRLVVEEAHREGLPVTAHAHGVPAVELSLAAGVDGIEHCTCMTRTGLRTPPELAARIAAAGTPVCPTLGRVPGIEPSTQLKALMERLGAGWDDRLTQVTDLYRAGVIMISGGDSGIGTAKPHGVLPYAIANLTECGGPNDEPRCGGVRAGRAHRPAASRPRRRPDHRRRQSGAGHRGAVQSASGRIARPRHQPDHLARIHRLTR
jgi:imidazolonepropionase-like amidohydrolase